MTPGPAAPPKLGLARKRFATMRQFVRHRQARCRDEHGPAAVIVWWTLFEAADGKTQVATLTLTALAQRTGFTRKAVLDALAYLAGDGCRLIDRLPQPKRKPGRYYVKHADGEG